MPQPSTMNPPAHKDHHRHAVEFYDSDSALISSIIRFVHPSAGDAGTSDGMDAGDGVAVIIATPAHRRDALAALRRSGVPVDAVITAGRLVLLDAAETLQRFVDDDGHIDAATFRNTIAAVLIQAEDAGGPVRVYGEMVTLLWQEGRLDSAMELERLWNELAQTRTFALLCGYPAALFAQPGAALDVRAVCQQHSDVVWASSQDALSSGANGSARWVLPAELTSGALARARLRHLLDAWGLAETVGSAELLTTELVNNAVVHAGTEVTVDVSRHDDLLRVEVSDHGHGTPRLRQSDVDDTSGRGLMLVEAMSAAWGTGRQGDHKTVWFELPTGALV